jgi:hypothetical protein
MAVEQLLRQRSDLWRGNRLSPAARRGIPSGFAELDARLPGGGWPPAGLSEILGHGPEGLGVLLPALARLSESGGWLLLLAPPYLPYAPALVGRGVELGRLLLVRPRDGVGVLWAAEQGLRSGACAAVLAWTDPPDSTPLRRLQLAAEAGHTPGFLFRPAAGARRPSPAPLRLQVRPGRDGVEVEVLKRPGGWVAGTIRLTTDH